jgi:predicted alpha/beta hydrolase
LRARGKRAALTAHNLTGEVACLYTHNLATGAEGNGTPPQNWTADWRRYAECKDGYITTPEEN